MLTPAESITAFFLACVLFPTALAVLFLVFSAIDRRMKDRAMAKRIRRASREG